MERRMYEAAVEGNVISLHNLLQEDALVLDRFMVGCYPETPLHIASMLGHKQFVDEIVSLKPELAGELDSRKSSPLHLASAKGFLDIVKRLISVNPDICSVSDRDGRNPLHIASMKGHVTVLKELVQVRPQAASILIDRGETIFHLCVRYNQLEAMKFLVETINDHQFVNSKDDDGNNILHLAVADKQVEAVKFLTSNSTIEVNALNGNGITAIDILTQSIRDVKYWEIGETLRQAGAISAKNIYLPPHDQIRVMTSHESNQPKANDSKTLFKRSQDDWVEKKRNSLMVVASVLATMAFQACLSPPGGLWQDTKTEEPKPHQAGSSIMAEYYPTLFKLFTIYNTTGFAASLSIILLLISGLPCVKRWFFMWILTVIMWVAIFAMALTYQTSMYTLTGDGTSVFAAIMMEASTLNSVMYILLLVHMIRLMMRLINYFIRLRKKAIKRCSSSSNGAEPHHSI